MERQQKAMRTCVMQVRRITTPPRRHPDKRGAPGANSNRDVRRYAAAWVGGESFRTASRISLPGLNLTTARRGIGTSVSGRFGLRPMRALRTLTSNTPKFRSSTVVPLATASEMRSSVRCTTCRTCCCTMPVSSLMLTTRSRFVIDYIRSLSSGLLRLASNLQGQFSCIAFDFKGQASTQKKNNFFCKGNP